MIDYKRGVDPALLAEFAKPAFYPVALVRIDWPGEVVAAHTGSGPITFNGDTYFGTLIGDQSLGQISVPGEETGLRAPEATLTLYGPYAALLDRMDPNASGSLAQIWAGATTAPGGNVLVGVPELVFSGTISGDNLSAPTNDGSSGLIIRLKAGFHARVRASITHSNEDQEAAYPGDTFFERNARATAYRGTQVRW